MNIDEKLEALQKDFEDLQDEHDQLVEKLSQLAVMSLSPRDMIAMTVASGLATKYNEEGVEQLAREAYKIADAMLAERKKAFD